MSNFFFNHPLIFWICVFLFLFCLVKYWDFVMAAALLLAVWVYEKLPSWKKKQKVIRDINDDLEDEASGAMDGEEGFPYHSDMDAPPEHRSTLSQPIMVYVENTSAESKEFVLFGANSTMEFDNNGNDEAVKISSLPELPYSQLLMQLQQKKADSTLMRVQSTNTAMITALLTLSAMEPNGAEIRVPLVCQSYFSANQFQSGIIDIPIGVVLDGNFKIEGKILANTKVVYSFFPEEYGRSCGDSSFDSLIKLVTNKHQRVYPLQASMPVYAKPMKAVSLQHAVPIMNQSKWQKIKMIFNL